MSDTPRRYQWPDDYFRSERVFRVARATRNLYRQIRALGSPMLEDAIRFEAAVIGMSDVKAENTPVNYTTYRLLHRSEDEEERKLILEEQRRLLEVIATDLLSFLTIHAVKHCDPHNIAQLRALFSKKPRFSVPDDIDEAYLQLVALYSRIPVRGYVAQELNIQHFGAETSASFFLVHAASQGHGLPLLSVWSCTPGKDSTWETKLTADSITQAPDPVLDKFFIHSLLPVVRDPDLPQKRYDFVAIPLHTLHPSPFQRSVGTFLGWLFVHIDPWQHTSPDADLESKILPIVRQVWPLLDDYASSLLDGEIEERIANFGRSDTQDPFQFVKEQVSTLSGWICDTDPSPDELRDVKYYKLTERGTLLLVLMPAQAEREVIAIQLKPKTSTILPENDYLRKYGAKRFCQRIRGFYEQAKLRHLERQSAVLVGRVQEKQYQFFATSHELKKLARLIPRAQNRPFILKRFPAVLLTFSLPAASKLSKNDRQNLPPSIWGHRSENLECPCADYYEWLSELIELAADIQCIVMPGVSDEMAQSTEEFDRWRGNIIQKFAISSDFRGKPIPADFTTCCLLGVSFVCALRNVIQHSFSYDNAADVLWKYRWNAHITLELDREIQLAGWNSAFVAVCNPFDPSRTSASNSGDGTNGAIGFYLTQIRQHLDLAAPLPFDNAPKGAQYRCLIPLLQ